MAPAEPAVKGLFPARGGRGIAGDADVAEVGAAEAGLAAAGGTEVFVCGSEIGAVGIAAICERVSSGSEASAASISSWEGAAGFAAAFLAAAFFTGFAGAWAALSSGNFSINLRTTGASTVEDAERTNSPTSCNFARSSLLSNPTSFANS
jgi:hypothetical protein